MKGRPCLAKQFNAACDIQAVVAVAAIERAPPRRDDLGGSQLAQVVRDETLGLIERTNEFVDPSIAPGEFAQ
jgi:hypothetical protein